jgi:hypothetical protein
MKYSYDYDLEVAGEDTLIIFGSIFNKNNEF